MKRKPDVKRRTFALVLRGSTAPQWFQKGRGRQMFNFHDTALELLDADTILKRDRVKLWSDLDWTGTFLDNRDGEVTNGFLSPLGTWHGCPFEYHCESAMYAFNEREGVCGLEQKGYIHISGGECFYAKGKLTLPQIDWLLEHGYRGYVEDMEDRYGATPRPEFAPLKVWKPSRLEREGD